MVAEEEVEHIWTSKAAAVRAALRRDGVELQYWATPLFAAHASLLDTVGPSARPISAIAGHSDPDWPTLAGFRARVSNSPTSLFSTCWRVHVRRGP